MRRCTFIALFLALPAIGGQVAAPPPPERMQVEIRYRINADRDGRVRTFRAMTAELNVLGFVPDDRDDADLDILDPNADRLTGTIGSDQLRKLLAVTAVQTVLAWPAESDPPTEKPLVQISIELAKGLDEFTQRLLHEQAIARLEMIGFRPNPAYDDRGFTRIRGTIPGSELRTLLKDLRGLPAGWLLQATPRDQLPQPLRSMLPIRLIEVVSDLEPLAVHVVPPAASPKFAAGLREALADPAFAGKPMRVEAAFDGAINDLKNFRFVLESRIPGVKLEGVVGSMVTFTVPGLSELEALARQPEILALRLPPMATNTVKPKSTSGGDALAATRIIDLQGRGYRGQGRTIVVVAGAFDRSAAGLPANVRFVDLTPELSQSLEAAPMDPAFDGTAVAAAAHAAAPQANIVLVRVHPAAYHQIFSVARAAIGDLTLSHAMVARAEVLLREYDVLNRRRELVMKEYAEAFANLSDDERPRTRRERVQAELKELENEEAAFRLQYERLEAVRKGLEAVNGAAAVVNALVWDDGYAADGLSELSQFLDRHYTPDPRRRNAPPVPSWIQPASESTWSVWAGPAHDRDGDRVLEFADDSAPLPRGMWNREMNFLARLAADGSASADLKAGSRLRLAIQWREPHDPAIPLTIEPLVDFEVQLLRQYDPLGRTFASDEFALAAVTEGPAVRLMKTPAAGVYERTMEVAIPADGRYALRVLIRPAAASRFGAELQVAEVSPKITLRNMDERGDRFIFGSFIAARPGVGLPADSAASFTVGRCDREGRSLSLLGAGPGLQLRAKPDVLIFGDGPTASGSGVAAGTIAGMAACLADLHVRPAHLVGTTAIQPNGMLALPADWIATLPAPPSDRR